MCVELRAVWRSRGSAGGSPEGGGGGGEPEGWSLWAEAGHVICEQQLLLPRPPPPPSSSLLPPAPGGRSYAALVEGLPAQMLRLLPPGRWGGLGPGAPSSSSGGPDPVESASSTMPGVTSPSRLRVVREGGGAGDDGDVVIISEPDGARVVISAASGCLSSLVTRCGGGGAVSEHAGRTMTELLASPLRPCLWRALTDNDRGGSGGTSYGARWAAAGLDRMEVYGEWGV